MNSNLLKSYMTKYGDTQVLLAKFLGISVTRLNAKINETRGAEFHQGEIAAIIKRYNLTPAEYTAIFFAN